MRFIRLLGAVIIFYSLAFALSALVQLVSLFRGPWRDEQLTYLALNVFISALTFLVGVGLLRAKEWARILWLVATLVLLEIHGWLLLYFYLKDRGLTQQIWNVALIVLLTIISWFYLTRPAYKKHFR